MKIITERWPQPTGARNIFAARGDYAAPAGASALKTKPSRRRGQRRSISCRRGIAAPWPSTGPPALPLTGPPAYQGRRAALESTWLEAHSAERRPPAPGRIPREGAFFAPANRAADIDQHGVLAGRARDRDPAGRERSTAVAARTPCWSSSATFANCSATARCPVPFIARAACWNSGSIRTSPYLKTGIRAGQDTRVFFCAGGMRSALAAADRAAHGAEAGRPYQGRLRRLEEDGGPVEVPAGSRSFGCPIRFAGCSWSAFVNSFACGRLGPWTDGAQREARMSLKLIIGNKKKIFILVAAALDRHASRQAGLRGADYSFTKPEEFKCEVGGVFADRKGAGADRWRYPDLGVAGDPRSPGGEISRRRMAYGRRDGRGARMRARCPPMKCTPGLCPCAIIGPMNVRGVSSGAN